MRQAEMYMAMNKRIIKTYKNTAEQHLFVSVSEKPGLASCHNIQQGLIMYGNRLC
jgi:hypothetical protein